MEEKKYCVKCDAHFFGKKCPGCNEFAMSGEQANHLRRITNSLEQAVGEKYRKGAEEHGGNLTDLSALQLVGNAIEETIDQYVYLFTLREKLLSASPTATGQWSPEERKAHTMRRDALIGLGGLGDPSTLGPLNILSHQPLSGPGSGNDGGVGDLVASAFTDRELRALKEQGWTCPCVRPTPEQGWPFLGKDRHALPGYMFSAIHECTMCGGDGIQKRAAQP